MWPWQFEKAKKQELGAEGLALGSLISFDILLFFILRLPRWVSTHFSDFEETHFLQEFEFNLERDISEI